jgi:hypothetical protein
MFLLQYSMQPKKTVDLAIRPTESELCYWLQWCAELIEQDNNHEVSFLNVHKRFSMKCEGGDILKDMQGHLADILDPSIHQLKVVFPYQSAWVEIHLHKLDQHRFQVTTYDGMAHHGHIVRNVTQTRGDIFAYYGTFLRKVFVRVGQLDPTVLNMPCIVEWLATIEILLEKGVESES